ncbi:hypothetical protein AVEN_164943-1 [Araneus ventricosus]|uniref:Uncharacterized protein n=1 Tax=Araneus ventricosus TaxID=182803 RepID=A0A4Y2ME03_ARAVE|nr:hypothetical protein AVEN_164943-1 [Araneus ventricosus]
MHGRGPFNFSAWKSISITAAPRNANISTTGYYYPLLHLLLFPRLQIASFRASPRLFTGRISAFMASQSKWSGWIYRLVGYPNFLPHSSNSHLFFALTTGFGVDWTVRE